MSSRYYLPLGVIALAVAVFGMGAIFGLGVVKPSAQPPNKAKAELNFTTEPKVVQKAEPTIAPKPAEAAATATNGALSPIYPTNPNAARTDEAAPQAEARADDRAPPNGVVAPIGDNAAATTKAAAPQVVQGIEATASGVNDKTVSVKTIGVVREDAVASAPAAKPATEAAVTRSTNRCDARACASAYKSFREADCTYQPFEGPRQVCAGAPSAKSAVASAPAAERDRDIVLRRDREIVRDSGSARTEVVDDEELDDIPMAPRRRASPSIFPFSIFPRW